MKKKLKIVFVGGRDRGYECIKMLCINKQTPLHIFCMQEDEHEKIKLFPKIIQFAKKKKIPITFTKSIKNAQSFNIVKAINPDLIIVMGWRTLIPEEIISIPRYGAVGVHESLLPKYRGFAPVNWAVINGEKETGVTLFYLAKGVDSGDIIDQKIVTIGPSDTAWNIYNKTAKDSLEILKNYLKNLQKGNIKTRKQNHKNATYTVARVPNDGLISWDWNSEKIYNLIRGLSSPYPGAFSYYKNQKIIIQKASLIPNPNKYVGRIPGRVASIGDGFVDIITGDSLLRIEEIETTDGKIVKANSLITSIKGTFENS